VDAPAEAPAGTTQPAKAAPAKAAPINAAPTKAAPAKAAPTKAAPAKAAPTTGAPAGAAPAGAGPADPVKTTPPRAGQIEGAPTPADSGSADTPATATPSSEPRPAKATTPAKATAPAKAPAKKTARKAAAKSQAAAVVPAAAETATGAKPPSPPAIGAEARPPAPESAQPQPAAEAKPAPKPQAEAQPPALEKAAQPPAPEPTGSKAVATASGTDVAVPQAARTEAWAKLVADPGHSPELLALAAVQTIGPSAQEWARRMRESYPNASPEALARLAQRQFTRFGSVGSLFAAVAGSYAPVALLASNALTYAELVLHIAAAYGLDPTDERRAVDLLVLTRIHPSSDDAEAALAAARQPAYEDDATLTDAVWRLGRMVAVQAGVWVAVRAVNRVFPGTALLAAVMTSRNGARTMAGKATAFYRAESRRHTG
jgi:hypothetical protein